MKLAMKFKVRNGAMVRFRDERKLSQREAASIAGVDTQQWNAIECLRFKDANETAIHAIAGMLEMAAEDLVPKELRRMVLRFDGVAYRDVTTLQLEHIAKRNRIEFVQEDATRQIETRDTAKFLLSSIPDRERRVLQLRFMEGRTLEQVASEFGVTRERIRQMEARGTLLCQIAARRLSCEI